MRWEIYCCPLQLYAGKEPVQIIYRLKYLPYQRFHCNVPYRQPFASLTAIIGPVPCTPPTAGFGNMTKNLKHTWLNCVVWLLTWKRLHYLWPDLKIKFQ